MLMLVHKQLYEKNTQYNQTTVKDLVVQNQDQHQYSKCKSEIEDKDSRLHTLQYCKITV